MVASHSLTSLALLALLAAAAAAPPAHSAPARALRLRRQLADDDALQPIEDGAGDEQAREKRKLEGVTQAKFGIKNAVLGFVFGKINSLIDAKTRFVDTLDQKNIELNKQYGIEAPQNGLASLSGIVGQVIGPKLQLLGPGIQAVTGLLGGASGGGGGSGGGGLGSIISLVTSLSGSSSGGAGAGATVETIDSSEEDDALALRGGAGRHPRRHRRCGALGRRAVASRAATAKPWQPTTSRCSTGTRSAWTCRAACLARPCPCSSALLRSSATSSRTRRCATRPSCACSVRCSAANSRSRAWTRPPRPPPLPLQPPARRAPPPLTPTTKCAAADSTHCAAPYTHTSCYFIVLQYLLCKCLKRNGSNQWMKNYIL